MQLSGYLSERDVISILLTSEPQQMSGSAKDPMRVKC